MLYLRCSKLLHFSIKGDDLQIKSQREETPFKRNFHMKLKDFHHKLAIRGYGKGPVKCRYDFTTVL